MGRKKKILTEVKAQDITNDSKQSDPTRIERSKNVKSTYIGMSKFGILNFKTTSETRNGYHYQTIEFKDLEPFQDIVNSGNEILGADVKDQLEKQDINVFCTCFTGETKVLMADGVYKRIDDIKLGDSVITHTGEVHEVTKLMLNKFKGSLVVINGIKSTPNHPYLVLDTNNEVCWKEAKDITLDMKLLIPNKCYGYVYMTTNLINGKRYIGQHCNNKNDNYLGSGSIITEAIKKYGKENFKKDILEWCYSQEELDIKEQYYIKEYGADRSRDFYNISSGGNSFKSSGKVIVHKGKIEHYVPKDSVEKWVNLGYVLGESEYTIGKKSEISKKFLNSEEFLVKRPVINKKISKGVKEHYKKHPEKWAKSALSEETKEKISKSLKGRDVSEETKSKMSLAASRWQKGRHLTEEHKQHVREGMKKACKVFKRDKLGHFIGRGDKDEI